MEAAGPIYLNRTGNPGMAGAGMGGRPDRHHCRLDGPGYGARHGCNIRGYLHGHAADLCAGEGERGMLAGDLLPAIRSAVNPDRCA